jgi:large subunit ribosomal protein L6
VSRKGKTPIPLPKGVEINLTGEVVTVKGPKGILTQQVNSDISIREDEDILHVETRVEGSDARRLHGLFRALINNMIVGTSVGFEKKLEMVGVGYRAAVSGKELDVQVGFSHPTKFEIPTGISVKVDKGTQIIISGINKQSVGQFAAEVRGIRPPEPYQGKGIRYVDEYVRRKAGKAAKTAKKA